MSEEKKETISTAMLKDGMPEEITNSPCDCDRRDWLRSKLIREFTARLDKYLYQDGLPGTVDVVMKK